jgi:CHASE2 domain-containing sensor protein
MKIQILIIYFSLFFIATACTNSKEEISQGEIDNRIVLININNSSRLQIAEGIKRLNQCSPKIIAIHGIFKDLKDPVQDSILSNSIKKSEKVIFPFVLNDGETIESNALFTEGCLAQGMDEMWPADDIMNTFKVSAYSETNEKLFWTFPFTVVNYFDLGNSSYLKETKPNQDYQIKFSQSSLTENGILLDSLNKISCDAIKDKIVIMGDISYNDKDGYFTPVDTKVRMSSTIIFANIVSTILDHVFEESKDR